MKLKFYASALLIAVSAFIFSQEKRTDFTKKLRYELVTSKNKNVAGKMSNIFFENYISKNNEFLTIGDLKIYKLNLYTDKDASTLVNIGFNNRLSANSLFNTFSMYNIDEDDAFTQKYAASKLNISETILGLSCNQYILKPVFKGSSDNEDNLKVCINETNNINNIPVLSSIMNTVSRNKKVDFNASGLILKFGAEKSYDDDYLILKSMEDSKDFVLFDHKKAIADQKREMDSIKEERKKWDNMYANDSAAVAVDSAAIFSDSTASYYDPIPAYESTYKKEPARDTMNLAIKNEFSKTFLKGIPKHCTSIENDVPKFEMKDLDYHVKNYVGQMCDMYLTQSRDHNVAVKITLDEIRREAIFLMNIRKKLSEKDRKKLDQYLDNLD